MCAGGCNQGVMRRSSTAPWLAALAACVLVGAVSGVADLNGHWLPARVGYPIAILAWLGGLAFGFRGVWLPFAGIGAFGLATYVAETVSPSGGDDQRALVVLYLTVIPALFAVPALVGAGMRHLLRPRSSAAKPGDAPPTHE
jgi:hypothetical protein